MPNSTLVYADFENLGAGMIHSKIGVVWSIRELSKHKRGNFAK
jgi:hypothetical protein